MNFKLNLSKLNLSGRISLGYWFIILVAVVATSFCVWSLHESKKMDEKMQKAYQPLYLLLNDFDALIANSQKLSSNWIYQPDSVEKEKMVAIHETAYPLLKQKIKKVLSENDIGNNEDVEVSVKRFDDIISDQEKLMRILSDDRLYLDSASVAKAINILTGKIIPQTTDLRKTLDEQASLQSKNILLAQEEQQNSYSRLTTLLIAMVFLFAGVAYGAYWSTNKNIVKPILNLRDVVLQIAKGKVVPPKFEERADEIGEMTTAITTLVSGINNKSSFALEIGKGNYQKEFQLVSEDDAMGNALLDMRDSLRKNAEEERRRNWVTQGLAKFVDILRINNDDIKGLADHIIASLVKYLEANQGALFVLNDDDKNELHLEMVACYAYSRKKHFTKRVALGEGLVGQAYLEKETMYLTEVPNDFITITSGLGEALPRYVLIVPLKINEKIYGLVEIASFTAIHRYQIEFVEKLGESIASTISNVKINQQTKRLLIETQTQTEQMRAQEEEMRQNMEELKATQEEVLRRQNEASKLLQKFELVTQTTTEGLWDLEVPSNGIHNDTPFFWSDRFRQMLGFTSERDFPNVLHSWSDLLHPDHKQKTLDAFGAHLFDRTGNTPYDVEYQLKLREGSYKWFRAVGKTVRDEPGNPLRVAGSLIDIQGLKDIQVLKSELEEKVANRTRELQEVLASAQQKNEELSAQEEELRQNMEEMQATQEAMTRKQEEIDKAREENERIRQEEAERALKVSEMQKKSMLVSTMKLKKKVEELQQMKEELIAQEEELRQNMEEMQATQEAMIKKQEEVDRARTETEQIKQVEANRSLKISEMQTQATNKLILRLKATEDELRKLKSRNKVHSNSN